MCRCPKVVPEKLLSLHSAYCLQRDSGSSIMPNVPMCIPQCWVSCMNYDIITTSLLLLVELVIHLGTKYPVGPSFAFAVILQSPYNQCSVYLLFLNYAQFICLVFIKQVISVLAKVNLIAPITLKKTVQSIQWYYVCALKFTLLLPIANCK